MDPILPALALVLITALCRLFGIGRRPSSYPPGPPTLPVIGNLHQMPSKNGHLQFQKWAQEYGPIYSLILGTKVIIVLSSDKTVKDLLDKRSAIYSSRPEMIWENKQMLCSMLDEPEAFVDHIRRYTNSLTTQMVFGFRTSSIDDAKLKQLFEGFAKFPEVTGTTTAALLDLFPVLKQLPDAILPLRRYAKELHRREKELYVGHWMNAKMAIENGTAKPCFCADIAKAQEHKQFSDSLARYITGSFLEAGSDTTAATLIAFVQAMLVFPDVQKKVQEEIDRVCEDRLPTMEDEPSLQYIRGCVKESMRWMPTDILGVPYAVTRDDEYMGYKIPNGLAWSGMSGMSPLKAVPRQYNIDTVTSLGLFIWTAFHTSQVKASGSPPLDLLTILAACLSSSTWPLDSLGDLVTIPD